MLGGRLLSSLLHVSRCAQKSLNLSSATSTFAIVRSASTKRVEFICGDQKHVGTAKLGDTILDVVINNDLPLDGFGACEGTLACCTCHVILSPEHFERVDRINPASEEELDLLDLAPDLCDRSRLGCQIGLRVLLCSGLEQSQTALVVFDLPQEQTETALVIRRLAGVQLVQVDNDDPDTITVTVPMERRDARTTN